MNIETYLREKQAQLHLTIDTLFEETIRVIKKPEETVVTKNNNYEGIYPLANTFMFKGTKPISIIFKNERINTTTWKKVVEAVLREIIKDSSDLYKILALRNKMAGRTRMRLASIPNNMRSPLEITKNLYIETHYDTKTLMDLLVDILKAINYDYNSILISIRNNK